MMDSIHWGAFALCVSSLYVLLVVIPKLRVKQSPLIKASEDLRKTEARIQAFEADIAERSLRDDEAFLRVMLKANEAAGISLGVDFSRDEIDKLAAAKMPPIEINKIPSGLNFRQDLKPSTLSYDELIKSLKDGEL